MLLGLSEQAIGRSPCSVPPPRFRAAGEVRAAWPCSSGPFAPTSSRRRVSGCRPSGSFAIRAGRHYEKKVQGALKKLFPTILSNPWYRYINKKGLFWCQPDALLLFENRAILLEIKYSWTTDAWWQLRKLYEPVVRMAHRVDRVDPVIICRNLDPSIPFPEPVVILPTVLEALDETKRGMFASVWRL